MNERWSTFLLPLAFFIFPFTYAAQVIGENAWYGGVPYLFIIVSILYNFYRNNYIIWTNFQKLNYMDYFVFIFCTLSLSHIVIGHVFGGVGYETSGKNVLIFLFSWWIYFYISSRASDREIKLILIAICVSGALIAIYWIFDTYLKIVLGVDGWFQEKAFEYIVLRNNFLPDQVNKSVLGGGDRAYGLMNQYAITGAIVAISAFSSIALIRKVEVFKISLILSVYLVVLFIGFSTLSLIIYVLLIPFIAIYLAISSANFTKYMLSFVLTSVVLLSLFVSSMQTISGANSILNNRLSLIGIQQGILFNTRSEKDVSHNKVAPYEKKLTSGMNEPTLDTSALEILKNTLLQYVRYIDEYPTVAIFGEGYSGYNGRIFPRGGDIAAFEILVTFGIPASLYFFLVIIISLRKAISALVNNSSHSYKYTYLYFSILTLIFIMLTSVHYNIIFNKYIFALLCLALGINRRFCSQYFTPKFPLLAEPSSAIASRDTQSE